MIKDFFIVNTFIGEDTNINNPIIVPVAVFICQDTYSLQNMQDISMEINTKETIFIYPKNKNKFHAICFKNKTEVNTLCCGVFAAAKVINTLNPNLNKIIIDTNNCKYYAKLLNNNNVLVTFNIRNIKINSSKVFSHPYINILLKNNNVLSINKYNNTVIIETKYNNVFGNNILNTINCKSIIITSRSNTYEYDYLARFYNNTIEVRHMYNSVLIANYWYKKIKKIKLCGYLPQNKSYINTSTDNNVFSIECKCVIHSSGELLVDNI